MAKRKENGADEPEVITDLDDLKIETVNVEIERPDGTKLLIPMRPLGYKEWYDIGWAITDPAPPVAGVGEGGKKLMDYNDPAYRRAQNDAALQRQYRRLLAALKLNIPGDNAEEKIAALEATLDFNTVRQLIDAMEQISTTGEARIIARAASFHNASGERVSDMREAE